MCDNLMLHARLFHLGEQKSTQRTEQFITVIGLQNEYADAKATCCHTSGLWSAVAAGRCHCSRPEFILTSGTSGVDPQACDEFWRILVDLSRNWRRSRLHTFHERGDALRPYLR